MLYKCVLQVDGAPQPVEIMDTSASSDKTSYPYLQWAEAFVVVYSITDKESYQRAASTVQVVTLILLPGRLSLPVMSSSPSSVMY